MLTFSRLWVPACWCSVVENGLVHRDILPTREPSTSPLGRGRESQQNKSVHLPPSRSQIPSWAFALWETFSRSSSALTQAKFAVISKTFYHCSYLLWEKMRKFENRLIALGTPPSAVL